MTKAEFRLVLADGARWTIRALDDEARATVRELGEVMQLRPVPGRGGGGGRGGGRGGVCSVSGLKQTRGRRGAAGRGTFCRLGPARDRPAEVFRMERVATAIAEQSLASGGLLLHGALAVRDGAGFVLAGPSGVGKSTASRRLPSPWEALSDDCVFVLRGPDGRHWAHPWPTWSLVRDSGPGASWPVERAVPLKALLFLRQSASDRTEPVSTTPAVALVVESAVQLARAVMFTPDGGANRATCAKYLRAVLALAGAVPAFRLDMSLTGRFWDEIERAVATEPRMDREGETDASQKAKAKTGKAKPAEPATRTRSVPEPPRRLLSGSPKPRLVRFQVGPRTFLKLVTGRRVVASANDILKEWHVRRPSRR